MHIAILGATSQIAKDFICNAQNSGNYSLSLFARRPDAVRQWVKQHNLRRIQQISEIREFGCHKSYDALINFVGVGNPAIAQTMGSSILDITIEFDNLALNYLKQHTSTRYIFLSSGAAYGSAFQTPVTKLTSASFNINNLQSNDWYGIAKLHSESRHRSQSQSPILDLRVFSYFSRTQDISARFLLSDMLRAIQNNNIFKTLPDALVRDYLHPSDFFNLVQLLLHSPLTNTVVDAYTLAPIDKFTLVSAMSKHFGLRYEFADCNDAINATGHKTHYYSLNKHAATFGYQPTLTSWDGIHLETSAILQQ